ncbi:hypothetical protein NM208_g13752 [Fusarium decemcellulare]|uniref:Uncharacterized protein n=1 Tax=Fusarium decemcellulare TaxID=57161 RepID=A0ACC1RKJ2_9HYPO|nr:hypothetical protein NM208_g13752 [Fusarium decemcellulare]
MVFLTFLLLSAFAGPSAAFSIPDAAQRVLQGHAEAHDPPRGNHRVIQQNDSICNASTPQWTGSVSLGGERDMFFCEWLFKSRKDAETDPLIIWLNGGPGASSLLGAFYEIGPCSVDEAGRETEPNMLNWANFANMLFIEWVLLAPTVWFKLTTKPSQPIGVGFSRTHDPDLWTRDLQEGGMDFDKFLDGFLDVFPEFHDRPIHFAGESFGGKYVPVYSAMTRRKFASIILVDPLIDLYNTIMGLYDHFCVGHAEGDAVRPPRYMNDTACERMEELSVNCEKMGQVCRDTYDENLCAGAVAACEPVGEEYMREVVPGGRHPYDDRLACKEPPLCGNLGMERVSTYLNRDEVQKALGFPHHIDFQSVNMELNAKWSSQADVTLPSTRELSTLLDQRQTRVINTQGLLRTLDSLAWKGRPGFRAANLEPWYYNNDDGTRIKGGTVKSHKMLTLVTLDSAGHMSPHDQPVAAARVVQAWLHDKPLDF